MLDYHEKNARLAEAMELIKRKPGIWEYRQQESFREHKKAFPAEAIQFFCRLIDKKLEHTGSSYYHTIAGALKQIRQLGQGRGAGGRNPGKHYHRRRKLMALLAEI